MSVPNLEMDAASEILAGAIQIKTISYSDTAKTETQAFEQLHFYLSLSFPLVHEVLTREIVNTNSLLYTWTGTRPELAPLLLLSHLDVVPADTTAQTPWKVPPFSGAFRDGNIWGRGTLDDKSGVVGILTAVEYLLSGGFKPERTIIIAFGHDEEIGGKAGAGSLARALTERGVSPGMMLDEGGAIVEEGVPGIRVPVALVGIAEKGYLSLELSVRGIGGHSSMPPPKTAIAVLCEAIDELNEHPLKASLEGPIREMLVTLAPETAFPFNFLFSNLWAFGGIIESQLAAAPKSNALIRTTMAPTMFHSGVKDNLLPQLATAVVNFRLKPGDSVDDVIQHVTRVIDNPDIEVRPIGDFPEEASPVTNYKSPQYNSIAKSVRQTFPDALVTPYLTVGGTDTKHYQNLTDQIYRFLPIQMSADQLDGMHGSNEYITQLDYQRLIMFYIQFIENTAGAERLW